MTPQELKGLPAAEAIKKAAQFAGVRPEVLDNMWATESGRGTHPTMVGPKTRWGFAKGHFQQLDNIHATWEKRLNTKLDRFDFADGLTMAAYHMRENMQAVGGSEADAVAMYHGGTNRKNWGDHTKAYVEKVTGHALPVLPGAVVPKKQSLKKSDMPKGSWESLRSVSGKDIEASYTDMMPEPVASVGKSRLLAPTLGTELQQAGVAAGAAEAAAETKVAEEQRFWSVYDRDTTLGAAYSRTMQGSFELARRLSGDVDLTDDPEWAKTKARDWEKLVGGITDEDEQAFLLDAPNKAEYDNRLFRLAERKADDVTMGRTSGATQFAAMMAAGGLDPTSWLVGVGVTAGLARAGVGSVALINQGRAAAGAASVVAENVAGNVGYELVQDALGEHRSYGDLMGAAIGGLIPGAAFGGLAYRQGIAELHRRTSANLVADKVDTAQRAIKEVGPDGTPEAYVAAMERIESEKVRNQGSPLTNPAADSDRINAPDLDDPDVLADLETRFKDDATGRVGDLDATPAANNGRERISAMASKSELANAESWFNGLDETDFRTVVGERGWNASNAELQALGKGVHLAPDVAADPKFQSLQATLQKLADQFMPEGRIYITGGGTHLTSASPSGKKGAGFAQRMGRERSLIAFDADRPDAHRTAVHEFGHMLVENRMSSADPAMLSNMLKAYDKFVQTANTRGQSRVAALLRTPVSQAADNSTVVSSALWGRNPVNSLNKMLQDAFSDQKTGKGYADYFANFDEFGADQFVKWAESVERGAVKSNFEVPEGFMGFLAEVVAKLKKLYEYATKNGLLGADESFRDFFESALRQPEPVGSLPAGEMIEVPASFAAPVPQSVQGGKPPRMPQDDWDAAVRHNLQNTMPRGTPREQAEFLMTARIYKDAEVWNANNPLDLDKIKVLGNNDLVNFATPGTILASSENPVSRMIAGIMLESTTGAQGRRTTAALMKAGLEQGYIGNAMFDYDQAYSAWRGVNGGSRLEDHFQGEVKNRFNRAVMVEIEARRTNRPLTQDPAIIRAANAMEQSFERMRTSQVDARTVGWAKLPETSRGYAPHSISPGRLGQMTQAETNAYLAVLERQFRDLNAWDDEFSAQMARRYLDHARQRANGGSEIPANVHDPRAAEMVRGSLQAMGMTQQQVEAAMGRFSAGGAKHTKQRAILDLLQEYDDGNGGTFTLMDLFDTNLPDLLRNQARRVSGEVALSRFGIMGSQGLKLLRNAVTQVGEVTPAKSRELQALDQVAAEMLGMPFGTVTGKWLDRLLTTNATARLGGMGFTQLGEAVNGIWSIGVGHMFQFVGGTRRLNAEVAALANGQTVNNSILQSVEQFNGGGEFGLEGYKMITRFDNPEAVYNSYGRDGATWVDRGLRSTAHALGTLSFHRRVQAVQVRGMAEQITLKAVRFIREGGDSKALADMGFTPDLVAALKRDIDRINPNPQTIDLTQATDVRAAHAFAYAVNRGARQIIQGTFIGEQGRWAHHGYLKLLTQFRSFPLVAMEKQWARQRNMHGVAGALGILVGSMSVVAPVYMARVALAAQGREDRDEYLEKMLDPRQIARATLNYVGQAGLSGDLMDLLTALGPDSLKEVVGEGAGGRAGGGGRGVIASTIPALGYVEDAWLAAQNPTDPYKAARLLPFSNVPWLLPAVNALRPD